MIPDAWSFLLLALAAYRIVRLIGWDDITANLRRRVLGLADAEYVEIAGIVREIRDGGEDPWTAYRGGVIGALDGVTRRQFYVNELARCPWCLGSYFVAGEWALWLIWPHAVVVGAVPFALGAVVGLVAKNLDP